MKKLCLAALAAATLIGCSDNKEEESAAAESVRVVASFGAGATAALAAARRLPAAAGVLSGVGAVYTGLLYLHDRSAAGD